jgi:hypothetical protein
LLSTPASQAFSTLRPCGLACQHFSFTLRKEKLKAVEDGVLKGAKP